MFSFYCLFFFHRSVRRVLSLWSPSPRLGTETNTIVEISLEVFFNTICDNEHCEGSKRAGVNGGFESNDYRCLPQIVTNSVGSNVTSPMDSSAATESNTLDQKVFLSISNRSSKTFLRKYLWLRHCSFHFMIQFSVLSPFPSLLS